MTAIGDRESKFAIHAAARDGQVNLVESFLNAHDQSSKAKTRQTKTKKWVKANPRLATTRDDDDRLPVHWALSNSRVEVVQVLIEAKGFNVDAKDGSGWTPLMIACSLKEGDALVDLLLGKGADVNAKNSSGQTALHFCASKNNLETARKLVERGATARIKDKRGQLPLHRAAAIGSTPMVQLMLDRQSPINATDANGLTALHHAIAEGHGDTALLLLKAGADPQKEDGQSNLAIALAPDDKVRNYILQTAEREGLLSSD